MLACETGGIRLKLLGPILCCNNTEDLLLDLNSANATCEGETQKEQALLEQAYRLGEKIVTD